MRARLFATRVFIRISRDADLEFDRMHPDYVKDIELTYTRDTYKGRPSAPGYEVAMRRAGNYKTLYPNAEKEKVLHKIKYLLHASKDAFEIDMRNYDKPGYRRWSALTCSKKFEKEKQRRKMRFSAITAIVLGIISQLTYIIVNRTQFREFMIGCVYERFLGFHSLPSQDHMIASTE